NGLVVGFVFHLHDLSLLAFLDDGGDAVPVEVGVLHFWREGLGHLPAPFGHADRDFDVDRRVAMLPHPHPQELRLLLRLPSLRSAVVDRHREAPPASTLPFAPAMGQGQSDGVSQGCRPCNSCCFKHPRDRYAVKRQKTGGTQGVRSAVAAPLSRGTTLRRSPCCIATTPPAGAPDRGAMATAQQPQLVRLPDGRRLAFAQYGPPDGVACVVLSGMPGSRLAPAWAFPDRLLAERGGRLRGVHTPRHGRSAPNPRTSALGVADDLGVLGAAVGLDRFAVLGISVGAPFALACAIR